MAKRKNVFQRYFEGPKLKIACDMLMIISLILLVVGWIIWKSTEVVLLISFALFVLTSLLSIYRSVSIIRKEPNKRSPERRAAIVSLVISIIIFAIALFGLIWGICVGYAIPAIN
ncbi:MAG: DUF1218 domain-containing protein [Clostridiales bacterium]|nr:DUF1218 domain-containing protein [Clostridiales bacterium]